MNTNFVLSYGGRGHLWCIWGVYTPYSRRRNAWRRRRRFFRVVTQCGDKMQWRPLNYTTAGSYKGTFSWLFLKVRLVSLKSPTCRFFIFFSSQLYSFFFYVLTFGNCIKLGLENLWDAAWSCCLSMLALLGVCCVLQLQSMSVYWMQIFTSSYGAH